jgi:hypothetical protein
MAKTKDCDRCQRFSGYGGTEFLICGILRLGQQKTPAQRAALALLKLSDRSRLKPLPPQPPAYSISPVRHIFVIGLHDRIFRFHFILSPASNSAVSLVTSATTDSISSWDFSEAERT